MTGSSVPFGPGALCSPASLSCWQLKPFLMGDWWALRWQSVRIGSHRAVAALVRFSSSLASSVKDTPHADGLALVGIGLRVAGVGSSRYVGAVGQPLVDVRKM